MRCCCCSLRRYSVKEAMVHTAFCGSVILFCMKGKACFVVVVDDPCRVEQENSRHI